MVRAFDQGGRNHARIHAQRQRWKVLAHLIRCGRTGSGALRYRKHGGGSGRRKAETGSVWAHTQTRVLRFVQGGDRARVRERLDAIKRYFGENPDVCLSNPSTWRASAWAGGRTCSPMPSKNRTRSTSCRVTRARKKS